MDSGFYRILSRKQLSLVPLTRPSTLCGRAYSAAFTSSAQVYATKPKPLEHFVWGSLITTQSVSVPHFSKCSIKWSSVVSKLRPSINSFLNCYGSFRSCPPPPPWWGGNGRHRAGGWPGSSFTFIMSLPTFFLFDPHDNFFALYKCYIVKELEAWRTIHLLHSLPQQILSIHHVLLRATSPNAPAPFHISNYLDSRIEFFKLQIITISGSWNQFSKLLQAFSF